MTLVSMKIGKVKQVPLMETCQGMLPLILTYADGITKTLIVNIYMPCTTSIYAQERAYIYETLQALIDTYSTYHIIIAGDFNAYTNGISVATDTYNYPRLSKSSQQPNLPGHELMNFANKLNLIVLNGSQRERMKDPGVITNYMAAGSSMIDYFIVSENCVNHAGLVSPFAALRKRFSNNGIYGHEALTLRFTQMFWGRSINVKPFRGAPHTRPLVDRRIHSPVQIATAVNKCCQDLNTADDGDLPDDTNIEEYWCNLKIFVEKAPEILAQQEGQSVPQWFVVQQQLLRMKDKVPNLSGTRRRDMRRAIKKTRKRLKRLLEVEITNKISSLSQSNGNLQQVFFLLNERLNLKKEPNPDVTYTGVYDTNGSLIFGPDIGLVLTAHYINIYSTATHSHIFQHQLYAKEYFAQVNTEYKNMVFEPDENNPQYDKQYHAPITKEEVLKALECLKNGKASDLQGFCAEMFTSKQDATVETLWRLIHLCWVQKKIPLDWCLGKITLIPKPGDSRDIDNQRPITILSIVYKIYVNILLTRITRYCNNNDILIPEQTGFMKGMGTEHNIFCLSQVLLNRKQQRKKTFACFIDLRKAYDRVWRENLWLHLSKSGINGPLLAAIYSLYEKPSCVFGLRGGLTEPFFMELGLRQGCPLSPLLFNISINTLASTIRDEAHSNDIGIEIQGYAKRLSILLYADDIVLLAENERDLQALLDLLGICASLDRLDINPNKSKVVVFGTSKKEQDEWILRQWSINSIQIGSARSYKYLGVTFSFDLSWKEHISNVIASASTVSFSLRSMGRRSAPNVSTKNLLLFYQSYYISRFLHAAAIWAPVDASSTVMKKLETTFLRGLRTVAGVHKCLDHDGIRWELGVMSLIGYFQTHRLNWFNRLLNMPDSSLTKMVLIHSVEEESLWTTQTWNLVEMANLTLFVDGDMSKTLIKNAILVLEQSNGLTTIQAASKLRYGYCLRKPLLPIAEYLALPYQRPVKSFLMELRMDSSPLLRVESGRYENLDPHDRICTLCRLEMDDTKHCLSKCATLQSNRDTLIHKWNNLPQQSHRILNDEDFLDRVLHVIPPPPALITAWIKLNELFLKSILRAKR